MISSAERLVDTQLMVSESQLVCECAVQGRKVQPGKTDLASQARRAGKCVTTYWAGVQAGGEPGVQCSVETLPPAGQFQALVNIFPYRYSPWNDCQGHGS